MFLSYMLTFRYVGHRRASVRIRMEIYAGRMYQIFQSSYEMKSSSNLIESKIRYLSPCQKWWQMSEGLLNFRDGSGKGVRNYKKCVFVCASAVIAWIKNSFEYNSTPEHLQFYIKHWHIHNSSGILMNCVIRHTWALGDIPHFPKDICRSSTCRFNVHLHVCHIIQSKNKVYGSCCRNRVSAETSKSFDLSQWDFPQAQKLWKKTETN